MPKRTKSSSHQPFEKSLTLIVFRAALLTLVAIQGVLILALVVAHLMSVWFS